jgi:DNA-binding NtrC family response regulator
MISPPAKQSRASILVVDDDPDVLTAARLLLQQHFAEVRTSEAPQNIESLMAAGQIDVFLLDMNFAVGRNAGSEGLHWLSRIRSLDPDAVVVLMTAFGDLNTAVQAMREGAADFIVKPWQNDRLLATIKVAAELRRTRQTVNALSVLPPSRGMVAESAAMREVLRIVARVAPTDASILIRGENGTGKELVARALHAQSQRAGKVLVTVDLGAIAESLFESELFGHKQGAFTNAVRDRAGRFQAADDGTLFLDEIGNLPLALQSKLLRVLESREVVPLGSNRSLAIDTRLICATNMPLESMVADGQFREDLLYRINTIEIRVPPLRERADEIPALVAHFVALYARKYHLPEKRLTSRGMDELRAHHWPGNVRELSHAVERALILSENAELDAGDFQLGRVSSDASPASLNLDDTERRLVTTALRNAAGNISHAATALGITRAALYRRIEKFGL